MKNVAVTGCAGYLGNLLLQRIAREDEVELIVGIDVKEPEFKSPKLKFYKQDVRQPFDNIFAENQVDTAIHFAFIVAPIRDEGKAHQVNIEGSKNFLDASVKANVEQVFYMGSYSAYGAFADNPEIFTEDMPLNPNLDFPYPCDKAEVDHMFQKFAADNPDICVTIGRTAAVTGPGGEKCGLTVLFIPVMVKPIGCDPVWQFIHEDDLLDIIVTLLKQRKAGIYNLNAEGGLKYSEMAKLLHKPCISLPFWFLYWNIKITWRLRLQAKSQAGGLHLIRYSTLMTSEKLIKDTGYKFRYTGPEAFSIFLKAMGKG